MSNEKNYICIETQPQRGFLILYLNVAFIFNGKPPCQMKRITYIYNVETQPQRGFLILYLNVAFIFNGKPPCQMKGITYIETAEYNPFERYMEGSM